MAQRKQQLAYKPDFLKYGFTHLKDRSGNVHPQCVQCLQVLANESMKENKLKRHLCSVHPNFFEKPLSYWKDKEEQTDESVDIAGEPQLMVFVRYIGDDRILEEFLFCNALSTTTTGEDIFVMVDSFFKKHNIDWSNCLAVCSDGAPSMIGSRVGFVTRVKGENPDVIIIHCFLHRENLASQHLQPELHVVLNDVIQIVNFIKARALNSRIFRKICEEMGSHHQDLLFHSDVRWLSRGRILGRVIELKTEI
ncbi:hypothetical protein Pcinc_003894 [Petrolisthes cinctipes]|uniref:Uncharacterized protein n=1 Tax=Petrolisthes cinctipes TaxID=88211 RepID=A0AAE1GFJ2_PETCI|nr:hypothetical protein Pcinc_003894 [Petrolisthes cinctipes]